MRSVVRSWEFTFVLDPEGTRPLFLQLADAVLAGIRSGRLVAGARLPGSRTLAIAQNVHRNTVLAAYAELSAQGWIETTSRAGGTFIARCLPVPPQGPEPAPAGRRPSLTAYDVPPPLALPSLPVWPAGTLVLARAAPDLRLVPVGELTRAYRRALVRHGPSLLGYGDPTGHVRLRTELAEMLSTTRGISVGPDDVVVARGSQMALNLVARALVRPGDAVAVEALGSPPAWAALRLAGAQLVPVPVDGAGLDVALLARLAEGRRIQAVYVTPHHQFPTTAMMPATRRMQLLKLARECRFAIIEDDYDYDFHYEGRPALPLAARDEAGVVVYIGTLSKVLAPGLRIGYVVAPPSVLERVRTLRRVADLQGDLAQECAVAGLFEDGEFMRHVRRMRRVYRARRDALVGALQQHLTGALEFDVPLGGMALWTRVAPEVDVGDWAARAVNHGVGFIGGRIFDFDGAVVQAMRLGFSALSERELEDAAKRMAAALPPARRASVSAASRPEQTRQPLWVSALGTR